MSIHVSYKNQAKDLGGISAPATVIWPSLAASQSSWWTALLSLGEWQQQLPFKPRGETVCVFGGRAEAEAEVGQSTPYF